MKNLVFIVCILYPTIVFGQFWDFNRASTAHKTFTAGGAHAINNYMTEVAANIPRVAGGLLVEGAATNEADYSETFNNWTQVRTSIVSNSAVALDGSTTVDTLHEDGTAADVHFIYRLNAVSVTAGENWTYSVYVKEINRDWIFMQLEGGGVNLQGSFNAARCVAGTMHADVDRYGAEQMPNGFCRIWVSGEADATGVIETYLYPESADDTVTFDGLDQDSLYIWGAQVEESTFPTSYIETTGTASVTRTADDVTMFPVRFTGLPLDGSETMWIDFSQDPSGATITTSDGGYTLTKNGQPEHERTEVFGDYHTFDGVSDWWSSSDAAFSPAGDFSVQCVFRKHIVTSNMLTARWGGAGDRDWYLYTRNAPNAIDFFVSEDGGTTTTTISSPTNSFELYRPVLVTATYHYVASGSSEMRLYVNNLATVSSNVAVGPISAGAADFTMGASSLGGERFVGDLLYCDYSNGVVLTEAQHDAAYAQFVQDYVLPKGFGGAGQPDKLTVSFDAKCEYSDSTDVGILRTMISISGNTGTASNTRNNFRVYPYTSGKLYFEFRDDADADHYANLITGTVDWAEWHSYRFFVDFADLSRMDAWVDGDNSFIEGWVGRSGTAEFDLTNTKIRIGQDYFRSITGNCSIKNLDIRPEEIRP